MIWLKIVLGIVVVLAAYVVIAGIAIPRGHVAIVRATLAQPPAEVWRAVTDHASQGSWRKDLKSIEMQPSRDGRIAFTEVGGHGPIGFVVEEAVPMSRYVVRILDEELPFGGRWIFALEPAGAGSRLTITEDGEVKNLVFRALSPFFSKTATMEGYLRVLGAKFGETVTPEVVQKG